MSKNYMYVYFSDGTIKNYGPITIVTKVEADCYKAYIEERTDKKVKYIKVGPRRDRIQYGFWYKIETV